MIRIARSPPKSGKMTPLLAGMNFLPNPPFRYQTSSLSYVFGPQLGTENTESTTYCMMFANRLRRSISRRHPYHFRFTCVSSHSEILALDLSAIHTTNTSIDSFVRYHIPCFLYNVIGILMASAIKKNTRTMPWVRQGSVRQPQGCSVLMNDMEARAAAYLISSLLEDFLSYLKFFTSIT